MRNKLAGRIEHVIWLLLWIIPIPFGAFSTDRMGLVTISLLLFLLLSIFVPAVFRYRQVKKKGESPYVRIPFILYGGFVGMFIGLGILNGVMAFPIWKIYTGRLVLYTIWMIFLVFLQYGFANLFSYWHERRRSFWYSEFLDPVLYSLPLPCSLLGMFLFPAVSTTDLSGQILMGVAIIMSSMVYLFAVFVLATFAFYFYPKKNSSMTLRMHILSFVRIFVMGVVWIFINVMVFNTKTAIMGTIVFTLMPVLQNNFLVFFSPFVYEAIVITIAVAVSNIVILAFRDSMEG